MTILFLMLVMMMLLLLMRMMKMLFKSRSDDNQDDDAVLRFFAVGGFRNRILSKQSVETMFCRRCWSEAMSEN